MAQLSYFQLLVKNFLFIVFGLGWKLGDKNLQSHKDANKEKPRNGLMQKHEDNLMQCQNIMPIKGLWGKSC